MRRLVGLALAALVALLPRLASAQSAPDLPYGYVPTSLEWMSYFAAKTDWPPPVFTQNLPGAVPSTGIGLDGRYFINALGQWTIPAGGSASPGGSSGQVQFNNLGAFGGFTVSGDGTLNTGTGTLTVTKSNGVAFSSAAFTSIGTSGAVIGLLNGGLTFGGADTFTLAPTITALAGGGTQCVQVSNAGLMAGTGAPCGSGGGGSVTSVFGRAGVVVAATNDYSFSQISGVVAAAQLPAPTATTLGGVESLVAVSHNFLDSISTAGAPHASQPAFGDLSGSATCSQLPALTGDTTTTAGNCATTTAHVNGVAYGSSPSTNTVPVVTGANAITYEAVPNAALANSSLTIAGHSIALGGTQTLACSDLTGVAASCATDATNATNISSGTLGLARLGSSYTNGQLLIGSTSDGLLHAGTLTAGLNVTITNSPGGITIAASGGGGGCSTSGTNGQLLSDNGAGGCASNTVGNGLTVDTTGHNVNLTLLAKTVTSSCSVNSNNTGCLTNTTGDMGGIVNLGGTGGTLTLLAKTGALWAPGMTFTINVTGTGNWTVTNSSTLTLTGLNSTTLPPGTQGTFTANNDAAHLDFAPGMQPPTTVALGGLLSSSAPSNQFANGVSTAGVISYAQPSFGNLSGSATCAQLPALTGDTTTTAGACATTTAHVNGVAYGASPSTNTVAVVTGTNATTYETVPNAALANSSMTLAGHSVALGGTQAFAIGDLSNIAGNTFVGNNSVSAGVPLALTQAQATALLNAATVSLVGTSKVDNLTLTNTSGTYSCTTATTLQIGCSKPDGSSIIISGGIISAPGSGGGTVNSGTQNQFAYYATSTNAVSTLPGTTVQFVKATTIASALAGFGGL